MIENIFRYPIKSMLGESLPAARISSDGVIGDRRWAVLDAVTGMIASAKRPSRWSRLLEVTARADEAGGTTIELPDGQVIHSEDRIVDERLSAFLGRPVHLTESTQIDDVTIERTDPTPSTHLDQADAPLELGSVTTNPLGAASGPHSLFDYAPIHLVARASLDAVGCLDETERFRPNLVVDLPGGPFIENRLVDSIVTIGDAQIQVITPTPRCVVPTLTHGSLTRRAAVLREVAGANRPTIDGLGPTTCLGAYAVVTHPGTVTVGDPVTVHPGEPRPVKVAR